MRFPPISSFENKKDTDGNLICRNCEACAKNVIQQKQTWRKWQKRIGNSCHFLSC